MFLFSVPQVINNARSAFSEEGAVPDKVRATSMAIQQVVVAGQNSEVRPFMSSKADRERTERQIPLPNLPRVLHSHWLYLQTPGAFLLSGLLDVACL